MVHVHDLLTIPSPGTQLPPPSLLHATLQRDGLPDAVVGVGSGLRSITRRLAGQPGRIGFAFATDWSFTSSCFPPRLLTTQLLSVTGRRAHA